MEVQQAPHLNSMHPVSHNSPYKPGYMSAYDPQHYGHNRLPHDEDSSQSHHSDRGMERTASPNPADSKPLHHHHHQYPTASVYGSFYKSMPAHYAQNGGRHSAGDYPGYSSAVASDAAEGIMDFSQRAMKRDPDSPAAPPRSPHDEPSLHGEDSQGGYGSGHHAVTGGMVGAARLDSEGSSLKSSSVSDSGSCVSDGHPSSQSQSPLHHQDRHSPLSTTSSDNDQQYARSHNSASPADDQPVSSENVKQEHVEAEGRRTPPSSKHHHNDPQVTQIKPESSEIQPPKTPENAPTTPPSDSTGSAKKQRLSSPNMNKIEAVINNLRTAKARKKKDKEPSPPPANGHPQLPPNDPRNLWAMYALSQYAMMAPGAATPGAGYYPYPSADGAAPYHYPLSAAASMMGHHGTPQQQHLSPVNGSPGGVKRKLVDTEDNDYGSRDAAARQQQSPEDRSQGHQHHHHHHHPDHHNMKTDAPLDFSRAAPAQSPPPQNSNNSNGAESASYSPSQRLNRTRSPATKSKNRETKEAMMAEHSALWADLKELATTMPGARALFDTYQRSVDDFETERYQALLDNISSDRCKDAVHAYFNQERHSLVKRVRKQVTELRQQAEAAHSLVSMPHMIGRSAAAQNPFSHSQSSPFTPVMTTSSMAAYPYANALYGLANGAVSTAGAAAVPNFGAYSPMASYMASAMSDDATAMYNTANGDEAESSGGKRKFLTPEAVSILQAWYDKNAEHPYPDEETVDELSRGAKVSPAQVKKWMANKRVRSSNTLAFNGSIHPKKIQKLIQLKELAESAGHHHPHHPHHHANGSSPAAAAAHQMPPQMPPVQSPQNGSLPPKPARNVGGASSGKKNKRLLDPSAVAYMTKWYHEHIMYPYPTDEEKHQIADKCSLSVSQVTCWFANKRNRSNHSRKHSLVTDVPAMQTTDTVYDKFKQGEISVPPQEED